MSGELDRNKTFSDGEEPQAALPGAGAMSGAHTDLAGYRADELVRLIENFEGAVRFVPDWSDEPVHRVAA